MQFSSFFQLSPHTQRKRRVEVDNEPLDGSVNSDFDDDRNISRDHEPSSGVEMNETKNKKLTSIFKKPRLGFVTKKSLLDDHSTAASSAYSRQV